MVKGFRILGFRVDISVFEVSVAKSADLEACWMSRR